MSKRIRSLLVSVVVALLRPCRKNKSATGEILSVNTKLSDYLSADAACEPAGDSFDIGELQGCHTGSFDAVLLRLLDWATTNHAPNLLWLTGTAGIGKSTLAHSFITRWKSEGHSPAFFFFSRRNGARQSIHSLVPTIACQIAHAVPELQSHIHKAFAENPSSHTQPIQSQFERFISNPILRSNLAPRRRRASLPILIVIDGLDECDDGRRLFVKTMLEAAPRLRRYLKFLIISRPECDLFESASIQNEIAAIDLTTYFMNAAVAAENDVFPKGVCGPARPLRNSRNEIDVLFRSVLSSSRTSQATIVRLLSVVLVCQQADVSLLVPFNDTSGTLTQSDGFMASILDMEPASFRSALSDLKPLLGFRRNMTVEGRDVHIVDFCHKSLKNFLVDQSRAREFHVDLKDACLTVANAILRILADEKRRYLAHQLECGLLPAYHNCLLRCYERLTPDRDLQRAMMEYNPIDYLSSGRESITYPTAVALFTFACKLLRHFEELQSFDDISGHLRSHLDFYLRSELDYWVPRSSYLMRVLRATILPDRIDWESFRASEALLKTDHGAISRRLDDPRVVEEHLPYFLTWMFDKGLGYAGGTVERTVCDFFYSENRAGKHYFGRIAGV